MSTIAGQTAETIELKLFVDTHGWPCRVFHKPLDRFAQIFIGELGRTTGMFSA